MNPMDNERIDKLLEDISTIRSAIDRNKPLLQQVMMPTHFRLLGLIAGLSIICFTLPGFFSKGTARED
jgi:hypothetical protein